jgi:hypothetical protein
VGQIATVQTGRGSIVKRLAKFSAHGHDETSFRGFLEEANSFGCYRPSSYPDVFHSAFYSPVVHNTVNRLFAPVARFAWQEALRPGKHPGHWRRYDINRAYLWASTQGLPVINSFRKVEDWNGNYPGIYRVTLAEISPSAPYPFNTYVHVNATSEEIDDYGLRIACVHGGVCWTDSHASDLCTKIVDKMSFGKYVAKAYWGRWASLSGVTCMTPQKIWQLKDNKQNLVYAHLVVSRVKRRLYEHVSHAAHVYVDSIIVPYELPTSTALGEWKLEKDYPSGVFVQRTGMYGASCDQIDAATGIRKAS